MITQARLKEVVSYDKETGLFTSLVNRGKKIKAGQLILGKPTTDGYLLMMIDNKHCYQHRLAFLYVEGFMPKMVDHKNRIRHDNRFENLVPSNDSHNNRNVGLSKNNTSGKRGVTFVKAKNRWLSRIVNNEGKTIHKFHMDYEDAVQCRIAWEKEFGYPPDELDSTEESN